MPESSDPSVRNKRHSIEFLIGQHSLFLGAGGQSFFYIHLFKPHFPVWIAVPFFLTPWVVVFLIFFTNRPLFPPVPARHYWLYAAYSHAFFTVVAEIIWLLGYMPALMPALMPAPPVTPFASLMTIQILMNTGWLSFIPIIRDYFRNPHLWQ